MSDLEAYIACNRFGLGTRSDDIARIAPDPRGWLRAQIRNPIIPDFVKQDMGGKQSVALRMNKGRRKNSDMPPPMPKNPDAGIQQVYSLETGARMTVQIETVQPFVERQLLFWSNHFAVSIQRGTVAAFANRYEVEAIRPHINGYFKDMLLATAQHPAMLLFLDNARSYGPNSRVGKRHERGLNENYAREVMELHTLGVDGGYTQTDVTQLANIFTGWSVNEDWNYEFRALTHEPGPKTLLGHTYAEAGEQEGIDALNALCVHPATAKHIAKKIARHFLSDTPEQADIDALAKSFTDSGGHLPTVMKTLIDLPNAWNPRLVKLKNPYEFSLAAYRLTNYVPPSHREIQSLATLNYKPFNALSPAGEGDTIDDLASPDAIAKRVDWAHAFSRLITTQIDPLKLAQEHLGPALTENTARTIKQAASGQDGLAFLMLSPEFQRR